MNSIKKIVMRASFFLLLLSLPFVGCSKFDPGRKLGEDYMYFSFSKKISVRDYVDSIKTESFNEGDLIDLYSFHTDSSKNRIHFSLRLDNEKWKPEIKRDQLARGKLIISAYYSILKTDVETFTQLPHNVQSDQSEKENFDKSKFFFSRSELAQKQDTLVMDFNNVMHKININILNNTSEYITKIDVRSIIQSHISLIDGDVNIVEDSYKFWITPYKVDENKYSAIIVPQTTEPYQNGLGLIKITLSNNKRITYKAPLEMNGQPFTKFESGKQTTFDINIE